MDTPVIIAPKPETGGIRVKGKVKWFDVAKGYGFIVSDDLDGDVLLHESVVKDYGCTAVLDGALVECDVTQKVKGVQSRFQALKLHSIDLARSNGASAKKEPRAREILLQEPVGPSFEAVCKWFSRPKGFGFVCANGVEGDIFVHMDLLRRYSMKELKPGQRVLVRAGVGPKGLTATEIHPVPEAVANPRPFRVITPAEFAA